MSNDNPKHRPSWFRFNFDDFLAEIDHLNPAAFAAAVRLMRAMWRSEDCTLADDHKALAKIARGKDNSRAYRWQRLVGHLRTVFVFHEGRVSSPWLSGKWTQATRNWPHRSPSEAHERPTLDPSKGPNPLKDKEPTSPNREYRYKNKEEEASTSPHPPYGGVAEVSAESPDGEYSAYTSRAIQDVLRNISSSDPTENPLQEERPATEEEIKARESAIERKLGRKVNWK